MGLTRICFVAWYRGLQSGGSSNAIEIFLRHGFAIDPSGQLVSAKAASWSAYL